MEAFVDNSLQGVFFFDEALQQYELVMRDQSCAGRT